MALNKFTLSQLMQQKMKSKGYSNIKLNTDLCNALAEAIVEHINSSAEVPVTGGSSSGTYKVK